MDEPNLFHSMSTPTNISLARKLTKREFIRDEAMMIPHNIFVGLRNHAILQQRISPRSRSILKRRESLFMVQGVIVCKELLVLAWIWGYSLSKSFVNYRIAILAGAARRTISLPYHTVPFIKTSSSFQRSKIASGQPFRPGMVPY